MQKPPLCLTLGDISADRYLLCLYSYKIDHHRIFLEKCRSVVDTAIQHSTMLDRPCNNLESGRLVAVDVTLNQK